MQHRHLQPASLCLALGGLWIMLSVAPHGAYAQMRPATTPVVYPSNGQTAQQQDKDRYECHDWARAQSGFDPARAPAAPPSQGIAAQTPSTAQDSATGAMARGAAGGAAIAELSSKDVGHGAAAGLLGAGAIHKLQERQAAQARQQQQATQQQAAQQQVAQQQAALEQQRAMYGRAFAACLEGRGYVVK
jgi:hypothetical protein